jgi:PKD repeat protein
MPVLLFACAVADSAAPVKREVMSPAVAAEGAVPAWNPAPRHSPGDSSAQAIGATNLQYTFECHGVFCTFDASASVSEAAPVTWAWDWGDGTSVTRTSPIAKKLFARPGIYRITLTITTSSSSSASITKEDTIFAEPFGMTKLTETGFNCLNGCGEWGFWDQSYADAATLVADPTAPRSPGSVVQLNFTPALHGGTAPASFGLRIEQKQTIYVALWMKLSPIYQAHGSGVNKVLHFWTKNGRNTIVFILRGSGSGTLVPAFLTQGMSGPYQGATEVNFNSPPELCTTQRGKWHRYEMVLTNNSPGEPDGSAQLWMDGVRCLNISGLTYVGVGQNNRWEEIWWSPTWGGIGGSVIAPFSQTVDHIYVSGK